jgi:hypothetical protein
MKAVLALSLLLIGGFLLYEVLKGNSQAIIDGVRGVTSQNDTTPSKNSSNDNTNTKTPAQTPQVGGPSVGQPIGGAQGVA